MSDLSVSGDSASRDPALRRVGREDSPPWRAADFQAALHRASRDSTPSRSNDEDDDKKPEAKAEPEPAPAQVVSVMSRPEPLSFAADTEEAGKVDFVPGAAGRETAAPAVEPAAIQPGSPVDLQNFAQMLDRAWLGSFTDGSKAMQVRFMDQGLPMTGLQMVRLPDGALSLTLAASGNAVPQVNKSLETLRRRLEARGLDVVDLKVEADAGPPPKTPYTGRAG